VHAAREQVGVGFIRVRREALTLADPWRRASSGSHGERRVRATGARPAESVAADAKSRAERELAVQYEVARLIAEATTLEAAAPSVLAAIARASGWEAAALWLVDAEGSQLRCASFWHPPELDVDEFERETLATRLPRGSGLPGYVWAIGRAAWVVDVTEDPDVPRAETARAAGLNGAVGYPVLARDEVTGVLEFLGADVREPDAELLRMLEAFQMQVGQLVERTRAEEALSRSRRLLHSVVEALPQPVFVKDTEGRYILVNGAAADVDGLERREVLGKTDFELRAEQAAAEFRRHDVEVMETGRAKTYERADSSGQVWLTSKAPLRDAAGRVLGVVGNAQDVTDQRKAEQALRTSAERIADLYNNAPCGYHSLGRDGTFLKINDTELAWLGYERGEIVGRLRLRDLLTPPSRGRFDERFPTLRETGQVSDLELELVRKDGTILTVRLDATAVRDETGSFVMSRATLVDITARKAAEEALGKAESELRQALKMEAVGRLAGGVAHDFNNLLTAILGYSDLLLPELEPDDHRRADVEEIRRAAERAMALTRQLLAFSRRENLDSRPLELNTIVVDIASLLRRLIGEDVELETVLGQEVPQIRGDRGQVEQVIVNLAVNAHDAMPNGGRLVIETANAAGDDRAAGAKPYALLSVTDTGSGMDEATLARIFDPYFTTKERGKGTGLGLSTVYGIVDSLGGHVVVDSERERGTRFGVYLPGVELVEEPEPPTAEEEPLRGTETVLLVEDEQIVRTLTARILLEHGYTVLEAARGDEALALAADPRNKIDLVVSDIVMPGMNGLELGDRLRRAHPGLRFVFVSGYADSAFGGVSSLPPDAAFVEKPFTPPVLLKRVREALDS
jgi:two-component system cell cycle sensor histidine kinase/response regulator CckA